MRNRLHVWVIVPRNASVGLTRDVGARWAGIFVTKRLALEHLDRLSPDLRAELGIAYCALELLTWPERRA